MAVKAMKSVRRVLVPGVLVSLYYYARHRAAVSPHAEVELGGLVTLGPKTRVASFCKIKATEGPVSIGARVDIGTGCHIASHAGGIVIGDACLISPNVCILAANYRYDRLDVAIRDRSEEHTSELQALMRISYAVFCLKKKKER